ncbi:YeaH/YhbH family protein [Acidovorax sp. CCYZU-2555]|uniref:YeaH/YhbH family protein n=1 Tax=Acidovorax sp. CCYZU-2555 TaxID=2835042 RepID=UPI001BCDBA4E|nr:YeaH/YhbH family protein [Acidovorax sp. CCYZU-2555]MBS7778355.1 YeaH/YhbH family protein [Acidovorax sp. CCYZU-2555]
MALHIIDRRLSGKNKSVGNRERFVRRYKQQIAEAVQRAVGKRDIRHIEQAESITIPRKDIREPLFRHGQGGISDTVHPGNSDHVRGDRIARPQGGAGSGSGSQASDSGEGEDDFTFTLSKEEFMELFFEDLALPRLLRTHIASTQQFRLRRAGYSHDGTPQNLALLRTMGGALGRRIALTKAPQRELKTLQAQLEALLAQDDGTSEVLAELQQRITALQARIGKVAFLDPIDLRFRSRTRVPVPSSQAVMFCLMDVSGSMDQARKELAKRFFILLYLFLTRHYEKIEIVFIRHHTQAAEVSEDEFFHSQETGGTIVSSALVLLDQIIRARYPAGDWNIYVAQASDGDNFNDDVGNCRNLLVEKILPLVRYYAYVQVVQEEQSLWQEYSQIARQFSHFALRKVSVPGDIYPVFRDLFKKEGVAV